MSRGRENRAKARKRGHAPRTERQRAGATFRELGKTEPIRGTETEFTFRDPVTGKETIVRGFKSGVDLADRF